MPELPEVHTIARDLHRRLKGACLARAMVFNPKSLEAVTPARLNRALAGRCLRAVSRRGKLVVFEWDGDAWMAVHLRMTGQLTVQPAGTAPDSYTRAMFYLKDGRALAFNDIRKFGRIYLFPAGEMTRHPRLSALGAEPLDRKMTANTFVDVLQRGRGMIKPFLLNQSRFAGIGNLYADEMLWEARIHPRTRIETLTRPAKLRLYSAMRQVLEEAIGKRGSTLRNYRDAEGRSGRYQNDLRVYGREGETCWRCGARIVKIRVGQRGTHLCPREQKLKGRS